MHPAVRQVVLLGRSFSLERLFATATGFDFTDLDITPKWGGADLMPLIYRDTSCFILTATGQQVGVILDKSKGFALGSELVTNGDFASATGWTMDAGWSIGSGVATHAVSGALGDLTTTPAAGFAVGDQVRCSIDMVSGAAGGTINQKGPFQDSANAANPANGSPYLAWGLAVNPGGTAGAARVTASATFAKSVDNFSVKKMAGCPAQQGTSAARPVWTANSGKPYLSFDGADDGLLSTLNGAAAMTIAACFRAANTGVAQVATGVNNAGATARCLIGTSSTGAAAGGWGTQGTGTITGGASVVGADVVVLLRANATTVELWSNGVLVYSGAPAGTASTADVLSVGNLNAGGTPGSFLSGRVYGAVAVQSYIADADVRPLMRQLGALAGLSF